MKRIVLAGYVALAGLIASLLFAWRFPAVKGLGTRVRLPVYHGAMTWATLIALGALLLISLVYLIGTHEPAWRWESALRKTVVAFWLVGTVLGFVAAYNTWDLSAVQGSALRILAEDPRLVMQIVILCLGFILLILPLVTQSKRIRSVCDLAFVIVSALLLVWAMSAGRALHPDSPVMNSPELLIKILFFMMVAGHVIAIVGITSLLFVWAETRKGVREIPAEE